MRSLSSAIIVFSGAIVLIAGSFGDWSREALWWVGIGLILLGAVGWGAEQFSLDSNWRRSDS